MTRGRGLVPIACLLALSGAGFAPKAEWKPKRYPIGFWCGPPDSFITDEQYRRIAEAGFTLVMPPCEGQATVERNRKILEAAKGAGLKAFIADPRMPLSITGVPDAAQRLDVIIADYAKHPALAGYFLTDEPGAGAFAGLGEVVAYLRAKDPAHPAYINLFPNYASEKQLGTASYELYIRKFIETVHPFAVSYDHYHFLKGDRDRPGFFTNLEVVRQLSAEAGLPFWQIVLSVPHGGYRPLNEAEKRWEAMQTLAYGAKGILYFTYWTPGDSSFSWGPAIVDRNGAPTPQYEEVKRIDADVQAIGKYLLSAIPVSVFQNGATESDLPPREQGLPVRFPGGEDITVGLYRADTHLYVLFANRDYRKPTSADVLLTVAGNKPERLNKATDRWQPVKGEKTPEDELKVRLEIAPGDGELYRW